MSSKMESTLPDDHMLSDPIKHGTRRIANRVRQLWEVWPWEVFTREEGISYLWTHNRLRTARALARLTTLDHAKTLLRRLAEDDLVSTKALRQAITICKQDPATPPNLKAYDLSTIPTRQQANEYQRDLSPTIKIESTVLPSKRTAEDAEPFGPPRKKHILSDGTPLPTFVSITSGPLPALPPQIPTLIFSTDSLFFAQQGHKLLRDREAAVGKAGTIGRKMRTTARLTTRSEAVSQTITNKVWLWESKPLV